MYIIEPTGSSPSLVRRTQTCTHVYGNHTVDNRGSLEITFRVRGRVKDKVRYVHKMKYEDSSPNEGPNISSMILHEKSPEYIKQHHAFRKKFKTSKLKVLCRNTHRCSPSTGKPGARSC